MSILFSIIRIDPDPRWQYRLKWVAAIFIAALLFFLAQLFWVCEPKGHEWKNLPSPQCHLGLQVVICQVVCEYCISSRSPQRFLVWSHFRMIDDHLGPARMDHTLACVSAQEKCGSCFGILRGIGAGIFAISRCPR